MRVKPIYSNNSIYNALEGLILEKVRIGPASTSRVRKSRGATASLGVVGRSRFLSSVILSKQLVEEPQH